MRSLTAPHRDPAPMLQHALREWGGQSDLWVFGYASLIWRPDFDFAEQRHARQVLVNLWQREMPTGVYDPRWLPCHTPQGTVRALAFTLSRSSPNFTGELHPDEYRRIFLQASGRYGSTHDYAHDTYHGLRKVGIHDRALGQLLRLSPRKP